MSSEQKKGPKKIEISSSSLVALKAELLSKQYQVQKTKAEGFNTVKSRPIKKKVAVKQNSGVELRAKRDEEQKIEEEPSLHKSRLMLEEKAKLYEKLSQDKTLLEEDTISEDQSTFLVDFQQKVVRNTLEVRHARLSNLKESKKETSSSDEAGIEEDYPATNQDEEWVDYVDTFGRTRRCLRKDLPVFQQQDAELTNQPKSSTSQSYGNFVRPSEENLTNDQNILGLDDEAKKRQRELWEEEEEKNRQKPNVHYQDVLFQEARQHGAGFYSFSKDEEERAKQMEELERIRRQTETARAQTAQTSSVKLSALEERLKKVRDRKRAKLGLPPLKEHPKLQQPATPDVVPEATPPKDNAEVSEDNIRKMAVRSLPQSAKVRPWDIGKEGVPNKKPEMTQHTWVEKRREERIQEFAPPSFYVDTKGSEPRPKKLAKHQEVNPQPVISEDSIASGLAFFKQMPNSSSGPNVEQHCEEEENDDDLMPPGEVGAPEPPPTTSRWRPMSNRGVEIAPPPSMDYYNHISSHKPRQRTNQRVDVSESFTVGIRQRKNDDRPSDLKEAPHWNFTQ